MECDFTGKVVLVTGASAGIGAATALLFSQRNASLALVGRNTDRLTKVCHQCIQALPIVADLSTDEGVEKVVKETLQHYGRLDVLVNNAGISARTCLERTDMKIFDEVFNLNVRGVYNLTRQLAPALIQSKGNIINVSSIAAITVNVGSLPYGMAKAALDHFTRLISLELAPKGVRVNTVSPGVTISSLIPTIMKFSDKEYQDWLVKTAERIPMGEVCTSEDIAKIIVFIASDTCRLLTGITLPVDGGLRYGDIHSYAMEQTK